MNAGFEGGPGDSRADRVARMAREAYHRPPPTPVEEIWVGIASQIDEGRAAHRPDPLPIVDLRRPERRWSRTAGLAIAASAILALGVGLGRVTADPEPVGQAGPVMTRAADTSAGSGSAAGVTYLAASHLEATESLFSLVRADARAGTMDREMGRWAQSLLTDTRLLLDAGASFDPALRELLLDLELLLAQVALFDDTQSPERAREEMALILRGLDDQSMMARIRSAVPAAERGLSGT